MLVGFFVLGTILFLKHKESYVGFYIAAIFFWALGVWAVDFLKPIYIVWMRLAFCLGWFNTRVILVVVFYGLMTPVGLLMRILGKDLLNVTIEKDKLSYWIKKEEKEFSQRDYERRF